MTPRLLTAEEFASLLRTEASGGRRVIAGLAGEPGAGKSTLAARLATTLGPDAVVLPLDGFHLPQARLVELGRRERMGAPDTFDVDGFVRTLEAVRADGGEVLAPGFDREVEEPVPDAVRIAPAHRIVLVEGNYLLHDADGWGRVRGLLDARAFLDIDPRIRIDRLVARHVTHGKTPEAARRWAAGPDESNATLIRGTAARAELRLVVD